MADPLRSLGMADAVWNLTLTGGGVVTGGCVTLTSSPNAREERVITAAASRGRVLIRIDMRVPPIDLKVEQENLSIPAIGRKWCRMRSFRYVCADGSGW